METIEKLAWEIIPDFYTPSIPLEHSIFFVKKFQTVAALLDQVADGFEYYLLNHGGMDAGYLGIQAKKNTMTLSKLYILKQYRGKGIGAMAMLFTGERAKELHSSQIELIVNRQNQKAIEFYEKRGFRINGSLVHKFENGYSIEDYKMVKHID